MPKKNLTIDKKIAMFQEKVNNLEKKKKELVKKQEITIKETLFQTLVRASKKNTTILDLILENVPKEEQDQIRAFFQQVYKIKFTTPINPLVYPMEPELEN